MLLCVVQNYNQITDRGGTTLFLQHNPTPPPALRNKGSCTEQPLVRREKHLLDCEQSSCELQNVLAPKEASGPSVWAFFFVGEESHWVLEVGLPAQALTTLQRHTLKTDLKFSPRTIEPPADFSSKPWEQLWTRADLSSNSTADTGSCWEIKNKSVGHSPLNTESSQSQNFPKVFRLNLGLGQISILTVSSSG